MSDENDSQNPIPEENPSPASSQEPTEPAPENTGISEPAEAPSEAPEAQRGDFEVKSNNIPLSNSTLTEPEIEPNNKEKSGENKAEIEPISDQNPVPAEPQTAQMAGNEPLPAEGEAKGESSRSRILEFLEKAKNAIQFRKRKKLDKIMSLFLEKAKITNDEVEKLLHVSDATATRYLSQLEKEGKIKQNSRTGAGVSYSRI